MWRARGKKFITFVFFSKEGVDLTRLVGSQSQPFASFCQQHRRRTRLGRWVWDDVTWVHTQLRISTHLPCFASFLLHAAGCRTRKWAELHYWQPNSMLSERNGESPRTKQLLHNSSSRLFPFIFTFRFGCKQSTEKGSQRTFADHIRAPAYTLRLFFLLKHVLMNLNIIFPATSFSNYNHANTVHTLDTGLWILPH